MKKNCKYYFLVLQDRKKLFFSRTTVMHVHLFVMFVYDMWQWESTEEIPKKKLLHFFLLKYLLYFIYRHENTSNLIMGNRFELRTSTNK